MLIIVAISLISLSACTVSKDDIRKEISETYENITLTQVLEGLTNNKEYTDGIVLHYENQDGSIYYYNQKYYLNLNDDTTFIYSDTSKTIQKYTDSLDETFQMTADNIDDFINKVEVLEDIEYRKFDYLIYTAINDYC